jgi:Holliday junction resolvase
MMTGLKSRHSKKETDFQTKIIKYLRSRGAYVQKIAASTYQTPGIPDVLGCYMGRFIAFECKTEKGIATVIQQEHINNIRQAGGFAIVPTTLSEVEEVLNEISRVQSGGQSKR